MFKKKQNTGEKLLGEKIHSNIFYVLHNKDCKKKMLYCDFFFFFLMEMRLFPC